MSKNDNVNVLLQQSALCWMRLRPDEQHEAWSSPKSDDEGAEDGQNHEVREDSVAAVAAWTLAHSGCQIP